MPVQSCPHCGAFPNWQCCEFGTDKPKLVLVEDDRLPSQKVQDLIFLPNDAA